MKEIDKCQMCGEPIAWTEYSCRPDARVTAYCETHPDAPLRASVDDRRCMFECVAIRQEDGDIKFFIEEEN